MFDLRRRSRYTNPKGAKEFLDSTRAAVGVCFGDIGTSPLYAIIVSLSFVPATPENVKGIVSLAVVSLFFITVWYAWLLMKFYHGEKEEEGEGGIPALFGIIRDERGSVPVVLLALGIFGVALLYGDGAITPAISVLSAVEGLHTLIDVPHLLIIAITVLILGTLFSVQKRGTQRIGRVMGSVMLVWFATLAGFGAHAVMLKPEILDALSPYWAVYFLLHHPVLTTMDVLGGVALTMTGGEAMYADRAHFGPNPLRAGWIVVTLPSLLCIYLGEGAAILMHPENASQAFLSVFPDNPIFRIYVVLLSTVATIFASQALISGVFSLTKQLQEQGFLPNLQLRLPDKAHVGQVYLPVVNTVLCAATLGLVMVFGSSARLANAYGFAVLGTMTCTAIIAPFIISIKRGWSIWRSFAIISPVLVFLAMFLVSNSLKFTKGGEIPVFVGVIGLVWMLDHKAVGTEWQDAKLREDVPPTSYQTCWRKSVTVIPYEGSRGALVRQLGAALDLGSPKHGIRYPYEIVHVSRFMNREASVYDLERTIRGALCELHATNEDFPNNWVYTPECLEISDYVEGETRLVRTLDSFAGEIDEPLVDYIRHLRTSTQGWIYVILGQAIKQHRGLRERLHGTHHEQGDRLRAQLEKIPGVRIMVVPYDLPCESLVSQNGHRELVTMK